MARTLLVFRHAKSGHDEPVSDKERTLTSRGRKDARRMGELAQEVGLLPDRVLCSTATRARETFELFVEGSGYSAAVEHVDALYLAEPATLVREIARRGRGAERVMLVGHNPGLEDFVRDITGERQDLPTAALVECSLPIDDWSELDLDVAGSLQSIRRPKDER